MSKKEEFYIQKIIFIYHYIRPNTSVEETSVKIKRVLNRFNTASQ